MKKRISLLLVLCKVFVLCGCDSSDYEDSALYAVKCSAKMDPPGYVQKDIMRRGAKGTNSAGTDSYAMELDSELTDATFTHRGRIHAALVQTVDKVLTFSFRTSDQCLRFC